MNLSTNIPGILRTVENVDFSYFIDAANVWGVDYSDNATLWANTGIVVPTISGIARRIPIRVASVDAEIEDMIDAGIHVCKCVLTYVRTKACVHASLSFSRFVLAPTR